MGHRIRRATSEDTAPIRDIYAPFVESTPVSFEVEVPSVEEIEERIRSRRPEYPWLVCESGETVVGYAAADSLRSTPPYRWTVELSVYVAAENRRRGIGTGLYTSLLAVLEEQGYCSAYAVTTLPNPASRRLHERLAFEPVGTFPAVGYTLGGWHDVRWWYRDVGERPAEPDPPTPLSELPGETLEAAVRAGERQIES